MIEKILDFLEKVLESHGKVLEFHIKQIVATLMSRTSAFQMTFREQQELHVPVQRKINISFNLNLTVEMNSLNIVTFSRK